MVTFAAAAFAVDLGLFSDFGSRHCHPYRHESSHHHPIVAVHVSMCLGHDLIHKETGHHVDAVPSCYGLIRARHGRAAAAVRFVRGLMHAQLGHAAPFLRLADSHVADNPLALNHPQIILQINTPKRSPKLPEIYRA